MKGSFAISCCLTVVFVWQAMGDEPPTEWVDHDTGHRIIRLSPEPGSESLYFNESAFTPQGDKMVMITPEGISTVDLKTRKVELIVPGVPRTTNSVASVCMGRKTRTVYYSRWTGSNSIAYATDIDTHATREIGPIPANGRFGAFSTVNADETLLIGAVVERGARGMRRGFFGRSKGEWMEDRLKMHLPMHLFTMNTKTGEIHTFDESTDWLNHVQASPTDPNLILFCHEGPWQLVDRIWTIHTDGSGLQLVHHRTMSMEIAGHEFFGADGHNVWYDLQTPKGQDFWVAGLNLETGRRTWYHLERDQWSVHFNVSPDGSVFAGDGGGPGMVAHAQDGQWIYLFRPHLEPVPEGQASLVHSGYFEPERLVNMARHDYRLEPNVMFTPDGKWIVFRSNMFGPAYVFEVEVARHDS